jgi:hypothetical protein
MPWKRGIGPHEGQEAGKLCPGTRYTRARGTTPGAVRGGAADAGSADELVAGQIAAAVGRRPGPLGPAGGPWHTASHATLHNPRDPRG